MKRLLAIIVLIIFVFPFNAAAKSNDFKLDISNDYIGAYKDSGKKDLAAAMGFSETEAEDYFKNNDTEYFAIKKDKKVQLSVSVYANELSELAGDISALDNTSLNKFAEMLKGENEEHSVYEGKNNKFLVFKETVERAKSAVEDYYSYQYITVKNGEIYQFDFVCVGEKQSETEQIADSFSVKSIKSVSAIAILFIALGIALFTVLAVIMIIGIIKKIKSKEETEYISIE